MGPLLFNMIVSSLIAVLFAAVVTMATTSIKIKGRSLHRILQGRKRWIVLITLFAFLISTVPLVLRGPQVSPESAAIYVRELLTSIGIVASFYLTWRVLDRLTDPKPILDAHRLNQTATAGITTVRLNEHPQGGDLKNARPKTNRAWEAINLIERKTIEYEEALKRRPNDENLLAQVQWKALEHIADFDPRGIMEIKQFKSGELSSQIECELKVLVDLIEKDELVVNPDQSLDKKAKLARNRRFIATMVHRIYNN